MQQDPDRSFARSHARLVIALTMGAAILLGILLGQFGTWTGVRSPAHLMQAAKPVKH